MPVKNTCRIHFIENFWAIDFIIIFCQYIREEIMYEKRETICFRQSSFRFLRLLFLLHKNTLRPNIIYHFVESLLSTHAWSLHKRCLGRLTTKQNIDNTLIRTYQWNASLFYEIYISDSYKLKPVNRIKQNVAKLPNKITLSESENPSWFLLNEFAQNMHFQLLA